VRDLLGERDGAGPLLADLGTADPGGQRSFDPSGIRLRCGDLLALLPDWSPDSVDFIATDPPYNVQLPLTMAGGPLAERHANRRTDYAMVSDHPGDLANAPDYATFLDRMGDVFGKLHRVLREGRYATVIVRDAYQDGRYLFTGADLAARASTAGFVPKGDLIWYQAGTRLRPYGYPRAFVPNIAHQHLLVLRKEPAQSARARRGRRSRTSSSMSSSPSVQLSATRDRGHRAVVSRRAPDASRRPSSCGSSLAPVRAQHEPVDAALLEQLDLVPLARTPMPLCQRPRPASRAG
jgi:hypothetical protein